MRERKNKLINLIVKGILMCILCMAGFVLYGNQAEAKSEKLIRFQGYNNVKAVQVESNIYYTYLEQGNVLYKYNTKSKKKNRVAKLPDTQWGSRIEMMVYYDGYLYLGMNDDKMATGIVRVNPKTGKVKKLYWKSSSYSAGPCGVSQFYIKNNKIYYAYSTGSIRYIGNKDVNKIQMYFASMNLDGSHKKVLAHKNLTSLYRKSKYFSSIVYNDSLYVTADGKCYRFSKSGKKTKISKAPDVYQNMQTSTSGCYFDSTKNCYKYKGYDYMVSIFGVQRYDNKAETLKDLYRIDDRDEYLDGVVLGEYILIRTSSNKKNKFTLKLINNKGKKIATLGTGKRK